MYHISIHILRNSLHLSSSIRFLSYRLMKIILICLEYFPHLKLLEVSHLPTLLQAACANLYYKNLFIYSCHFSSGRFLDKFRFPHCWLHWNRLLLWASQYYLHQILIWSFYSSHLFVNSSNCSSWSHRRYRHIFDRDFCQSQRTQRDLWWRRYSLDWRAYLRHLEVQRRRETSYEDA